MMLRAPRTPEGLKAALLFMTILPVGKVKRFDGEQMAPWFPVVGLVIGALVALADQAAIRLFGPLPGSVCSVVLLAVLTGALHLDGLADTADGIFSHRPRERALEIMKDSRVGVMGVVALISCLGIKWAGLAALESHRFVAIMAVPALARGSMLAGMRFLSYGRDDGTGRSFFDKPLPAKAFVGLTLPVVMCLFLGGQGLVCLAGWVLVTAGLLAFYKSKMGCITGDMLGAMGEVNEAALFLILAGGLA